MLTTDRLRPGQQARTFAGALTVLTGGVAGSTLPPGVHQFTEGEYATGTFWLSGASTGAYIYRFPFFMSNWDTVTVLVPPPAAGTRWGAAQHFWLFRGTGPGLDADASLLPGTDFDAHSWWDPRQDPDTVTHEMEIIGRANGWPDVDTVYVVVEVDAEHPKPVGAVVDLAELLTALDTLIAAPTVFQSTMTSTWTLPGAAEPVTYTGSAATFVPSDTGAHMTVQGLQFINPVTVTIDGDIPATGVHILAYETDSDDDAIIDLPGTLEFFAPPHAPAANDDDYLVATIATAHGSGVPLRVTYIDRDLLTQVTGVTPGTVTAAGPATITITGVNFEENGFWVSFWTDDQGLPGPDYAQVSFGADYITSLNETTVVLEYPFTDGTEIITLDPGVYHVSVAGYYYRYSDAVDINLTVTS